MSISRAKRLNYTAVAAHFRSVSAENEAYIAPSLFPIDIIRCSLTGACPELFPHCYHIKCVAVVTEFQRLETNDGRSATNQLIRYITIWVGWS